MQRVIILRSRLLALLLLLTGVSALRAQDANALARETALRFLHENPARFGLSADDLSDVRVVGLYPTRHNGVTHVWVQQQHHGVPVWNGTFGLHVLPDGRVAHLAHRFVPGLSGKVNTTLPSLGASQALKIALLDLGFDGFALPGVQEKINDRNWVFAPGVVAKTEIPVSICFVPLPDGRVRLAWTLRFDQINTSDLWSIRVDAQTGEILQKENRTAYCDFGSHGPWREEEMAVEAAVPALPAARGNAAAESYNVFALPVESPNHGARSLVVSPADPEASPYGWHDVNGAAGAEYTYTRGNNVWAYDDSADDDQGSASESVDGTAALIFDKPFDANNEPDANRDAAVVNLFYMNNMIHDIMYVYGFDEKSYNFQENNYGNGGTGGDPVNAEALDGGGLNNANFAPLPEGFNGRMQMFLWEAQGGKIVDANAPDPAAGFYDATPSGDWGAPITTSLVTADVVIVDDGSGDPTFGCTEAINDVAGKIVMVDRGVCEFGLKALNVQQAGGVACIICNFEDNAPGMLAGVYGSQVTIPVLMMAKNDCDLLRQYAGAGGLNISIGQATSAGPEQVDGDFDNGIIAHEYGHGISNRLTGGTGESECLGNGEQMGEGWSDFFALALTAKAGDTPEQRRGMGTFVFSQSTTGTGIRRHAYSTDMSINPTTYADGQDADSEHNRGEFWASVTWDLYWALVEKYGFDADITNTNSGNGRAIQLVIDGLKLQPCGPGSIDSRDAILLADRINYNGADTCLISAVFARRGLGVNANQGSANNGADGTEGFDPIPTCIKELKISKATSTPLIDPGQAAQFTITVTNHKDDPATGVVVTDELPAGLSLVSASNGGVFDNGHVVWNLGTLASGQVVTLTYTAASDPAVGSLRFYRDEMESDLEWIALWTEGVASFSLQNDVVKVGQAAWKADDEDFTTNMTLEYTGFPITVTGAQPVLRFWHQYNVQAGADGGFVEIRRANETQWRRFSATDIFRNAYNLALSYTTFTLPLLQGFSGNSGGWQQSYFDLSDYNGEDIFVRFHFGTSAAGEVSDGGWIVDEVEMIDMFNYEGQACVQSAQNDLACAMAPERGVIVNVAGSVDAEEPGVRPLAMQVQPNPASDLLHVSPGQAVEGRASVSLYAADGREVLRRNLPQGLSTGQVITLDVQALPAGVYLVRLQSETGSGVEKVVIR